VYGYCDATYKDKMNEEETVTFVKNSKSAACGYEYLRRRIADMKSRLISSLLAMSRDGSSGGCVRMCVIKKEGVRRIFIPGNELPR
jgi:20S proteasome subunit beta 1